MQIPPLLPSQMFADSEINANLCQPIAVDEATEPGVEPEESRNPCNSSAFEMWTSNEKLIAESKAAIDCNRWDKERWLQRLSILSQEARKWIFVNGNHETVQQCPLPNLECGETTKERLVELLNSIYPDQESSRSDISGFSLSAAAPIFSKYFSDINLSECRQEQEETKTECESTLMLSRSTSLDMESDDILATSLPSSLFLKDIHSPECPGAEDSVAEFCPKYDIDLTPRFQSEYVSTVNPNSSSCIEDSGSSKCPNIQAENSLSVTNISANYQINASKHILANDPLYTFESPSKFIGRASPNDELDNSSSCLRDTNSSTRVEVEGNLAEPLSKSYVGVSTHIQAENLSSVSSTSSFYLQDLSSSKGALKTHLSYLSTIKRTVSPNNPCPFLRSLVSVGELNNDFEKPSHIGQVIENVAKRGYGSPIVSPKAVTFVAAIANGLWPWQIATVLVHGTHLSGLRGGPLDKKGAGSRILNDKGIVEKAELQRMSSFGSTKIDSSNGLEEIGLNQVEITKFMDANFARAVGHRRKVDRVMMNAEWPVLCQVMGKVGQDGGRYLSMDEVTTLFENRSLPSRFVKGTNVVEHGGINGQKEK